jgi:hypothetical protein
MALRPRQGHAGYQLMRLGDYEQRAKRRLHNGRYGFHDPE